MRWIYENAHINQVYDNGELPGELVRETGPDESTYDFRGECTLFVFQWEGEGDYKIEIEPGRV